MPRSGMNEYAVTPEDTASSGDPPEAFRYG